MAPSSNSHATGSAYGGDGTDGVGGLVGYNKEGTIQIAMPLALPMAVRVMMGCDSVGGLVGVNDGTIANSYATGSADGGKGMLTSVGGLVGFNDGGTIGNSHATGSADGGAGYRLCGWLGRC